MGYEVVFSEDLLSKISFLFGTPNFQSLYELGDKNSRSQQLPQKPDHSAVLPFLRGLPQQQRQLVAVRVLFGFHQMAIFSKHLILLMGTDSATNTTVTTWNYLSKMMWSSEENKQNNIQLKKHNGHWWNSTYTTLEWYYYSMAYSNPSTIKTYLHLPIHFPEFILISRNAVCDPKLILQRNSHVYS